MRLFDKKLGSTLDVNRGKNIPALWQYCVQEQNIKKTSILLLTLHSAFYFGRCSVCGTILFKPLWFCDWWQSESMNRTVIQRRTMMKDLGNMLECAMSIASKWRFSEKGMFMLGCTEVSLMLYWSIPYGMLSFPWHLKRRYNIWQSHGVIVFTLY